MSVTTMVGLCLALSIATSTIRVSASSAAFSVVHSAACRDALSSSISCVTFDLLDRNSFFL